LFTLLEIPMLCGGQLGTEILIKAQARPPMSQ